MDPNEYDNWIHEIADTKYFNDLPESEKTGLFDHYRQDYLSKNPDADVNQINSMTEHANQQWLRQTGRGRAIPSEFIQKNNIIFPNQEEGYHDLTQDERAAKLEEFRLKIPEISAMNPVQREDTAFFLNQSIAELERRNNGEGKGRIRSYGASMMEGLFSTLAESVGATETAEGVRSYFQENPEYDDEFLSQLSNGAGSAVASVLLIAGTAAATRGLGGTAAAAELAGGAAMLGTNGIMRFNEGYKNAIDAGLDENQATDAGISSLPGAVVDAIGDRIIANRFMPKNVDEIFKVGSQTAKKEALKQLIKDQGFRAKLAEYGASALGEGASEMLGDYVAAYGPYITEGVNQLPTNQQSLNSFLIGGILGGGIPLAMDVPNLLGNKKGATRTVPGSQSEVSPDGTKVSINYSTRNQMRVGETDQNLNEIPEASSQPVYDLLANGDYKGAFELSKKLLEKPIEDTEQSMDDLPDISEQDKQEAVDVEEVPIPEVDNAPTNPKDNIISFKTQDQSEYTIGNDKIAERPNQAQKPESVIYVPQSSLTDVSLHQNNGQELVVENGKAVVKNTDSANDQENNIISNPIEFSETPTVGYVPVEIRDNGKNLVIGSPITEVSTKPNKPNETAKTKVQGRQKERQVANQPQTYQHILDHGTVPPSNSNTTVARMWEWSKNKYGDTPETRQQFVNVATNIKNNTREEWATALKDGFKKPESQALQQARAHAQRQREEMRKAFGVEVLNQEEFEPSQTTQELFDAERIKFKGGVSPEVFLNDFKKRFKSQKPISAIEQMVTDIQQVNPNVKFVLTPDIPHRGAFDKANNTVFIKNSKSGMSLRTVMHETSHALMDAIITLHVDSRAETDYKQKINRALKDYSVPAHVKTILKAYLKAAETLGHTDKIGSTDLTNFLLDGQMDYTAYSFSNVNEFIAETMANSDFQELLADIPFNGKTVWRTIVEAFTDAMEWLKTMGDPALIMRNEGSNTYAATMTAIRASLNEQADDQARQSGNNINFLPSESSMENFPNHVFDSDGNLSFLPSDKVKKVGAKGTAEKFIYLYENSVDWNQVFNKKTPEEKYESFRQQALNVVKKKTSDEEIAKKSEVNLRKYLESLASRPNLIGQAAESARLFKQDPEGHSKKISDDLSNRRKSGLEEWRNYLLNINDVYSEDPFFVAYVWNGITANLKKGNTDGAPALDVNALGYVYEQVNQEIGISDFSDAYEKAAERSALESVQEKDTVQLPGETTWIKIPKSTKGEQDYDKNLATLRNLSLQSWCTSGPQMSETYIQRGDFWMLSDKGKIQLAIRFDGDQVAEIQGPANNGSIPPQYLDHVIALKDSGKISNLSRRTIQSIEDAVQKQQELNELKSMPLEDALRKLGVGYVVADDGGITITDVVDIGGFFAQEHPIVKYPLDYSRVTGFSNRVKLSIIAGNETLSNVKSVSHLELDQSGSFPQIESIGTIERNYRFTDGVAEFPSVKSLVVIGYPGRNYDHVSFPSVEHILITTNEKDSSGEQKETYITEELAKATPNVKSITGHFIFIKEASEIYRNSKLRKLEFLQNSAMFHTIPEGVEEITVNSGIFLNSVDSVKRITAHNYLSLSKSWDSLEYVSRLDFTSEIQPSLKEVGDVSAIHPRKIPNLKKADNIYISDYIYNESVFPNLVEVTGDFTSGYKFKNGLDELKSVGGNLDIKSSKAPNLEHVGGVVVMPVQSEVDNISDYYPKLKNPNAIATMSDADVANIRLLPESPQIKITPQQDSEYIKAVENGDTETAQRMVDEAAQAAGYAIGPVYHGSNTEFDEFKRMPRSNDWSVSTGNAFHFSKEKNVSESYGNLVRRFYLKANPIQHSINRNSSLFVDPNTKEIIFDYGRSNELKDLVTDLQDPNKQAWKPGLIVPDVESINDATKSFLEMKGYDAIIGWNDNETAIFNAYQAKLADAVTYDLSGKPVPLSQRFNTQKNNINYLPEQMTSKEMVAKYKKLAQIKAGNLSDKFDARTQKIIQLMQSIKADEIHLLDSEMQSNLFTLIDNIYESRKNAVPNPQVRYNSDQVLELLSKMKEAIDASIITTMLEDHEGLVELDDLNVDFTNKEAVKQALNEYMERNLPEQALLKLMKDSRAKDRMNKIQQKWRVKYDYIKGEILNRFADADNFLTEYAALHGVKPDQVDPNDYNMKLLKYHFDYLTSIDPSKLEGIELYRHFFAINNLFDGNIGYLGHVTTKAIAKERDANQNIGAFAGLFRNPFLRPSFMKAMDKANEKAELHQTRLQRLTAFDGVRAFLQENLLGPIYNGVIHTAQNQKMKLLEEYEQERKRLFGEELNTEDRISISIMSRLLQFATGTDPDQSLLTNIKKERKSIENVIRRHDNQEYRKLFQYRVQPLFEQMVDGLENIGQGSMQHLMDTLDERIGATEGVERGALRRQLLNKTQEIFSRFTMTSRMVSEGFHQRPFKQYSFYVTNDVRKFGTEVENKDWKMTDPLDSIDAVQRMVGIKGEAAHMKERQLDLGEDDYYSYNNEASLMRNIERLTVDHATIAERFVLSHRIKKGSALNNIISQDENGVNYPERVSYIEELVYKLISNAVSRGAPLDAGTRLLRAATGVFARATLTSVHHIVTQPIAACADYAGRTGNLKGWMQAAAFYASNPSRVNQWFKENQRWTAERTALEAMSLDPRRLPEDDSITSLKNHPLVQGLEKTYKGAGDILTSSIRVGDNFASRVTVLAEYARLLKKKGYKFDTIDEVRLGDIEGNILTQATLNAERNINTSNKILRGELFVDRNIPMTLLRNILFAFSSHSSSLATQMNQAMRDVYDLWKLGAPKEEVFTKLRTVGSIAMQQATFTGTRFAIGAVLANAMIGMLKDLFDDDDGKIEELQMKVFKERRRKDPVKIAEAEKELANAKTIRTIIEKFRHTSTSSDSLFKQIIRDGSGAFHIAMNNNGIQQLVFMVSADPWMEAVAKETQKNIEDDYKNQISEARDRGNEKKVAKLTEKLATVSAAEYIPLAYQNTTGFNMGGLYGATLDSYGRSIREVEGAILGAKEFSFNDLLIMATTAGLGQAEVTKMMNQWDNIQDKVWEREKQFQEETLPKAKEEKRKKMYK